MLKGNRSIISVVSCAGRMTAALVLLTIVYAASARGQCVGDCDGDGSLSIGELITGVSISLGQTSLSSCPPFDPNHSGHVTIEELIGAVTAALNGCPASPTPLPLTPTPAATATTSALPSVTATETSPPTGTPEQTTPSATATVAPTDTAPLPSSTPSVAASAIASPTSTPNSPVVSATFTPTATPTMATPTDCGNGLLEAGESCGSCPADCVVDQCTATATKLTVRVNFSGAAGTSPITATSLLAYRSGIVSIPGTGNALTVRQRVTFPAPIPNSIAINDLDYALRVVIGRTAGLGNGLLYSVAVDVCDGAPAASAADFACSMEACAGAGGPIAGCTCTVSEP